MDEEMDGRDEKGEAAAIVGAAFRGKQADPIIDLR